MNKTHKAFLAVLIFAAGVASLAGSPQKQKNYLEMTWWDPYVENITDSDTYLRRKFRQDVTDRTTGVGVDGLKNILADIVVSGKASDESCWVTKTKCFAAQVEKQSIDVSPLDWFPAIAVWDRKARPISGVIARRAFRRRRHPSHAPAPFLRPEASARRSLSRFAET